MEPKICYTNTKTWIRPTRLSPDRLCKCVKRHHFHWSRQIDAMSPPPHQIHRIGIARAVSHEDDLITEFFRRCIFLWLSHSSYGKLKIPLSFLCCKTRNSSENTIAAANDSYFPVYDILYQIVNPKMYLII